MSSFLHQLLTNCPRLRTLNVTISDFFVSYEFFRALVFSKLESLSIVSSNLMLASQITTESEWPANEYLRSLSLPLNSGHNLKSLLITVFRKLRFIHVDKLSDMLVNTIRELQVSCRETGWVWFALFRTKFFGVLQTDLVALKVTQIELGLSSGSFATPFHIRRMESRFCKSHCRIKFENYWCHTLLNSMMRLLCIHRFGMSSSGCCAWRRTAVSSGNVRRAPFTKVEIFIYECPIVASGNQRKQFNFSVSKWNTRWPPYSCRRKPL